MEMRDSAASKNSVVLMALSLSASTLTSVKDLLMVSSQVPPGGNVVAAAILRVEELRNECGMSPGSQSRDEGRVPAAINNNVGYRATYPVDFTAIARGLVM